MSINIWGLRSDGYVKIKNIKHPEENDRDFTPLLYYVGVKDGEVDIEENKIINLKDPESDKDAVNKEYCDRNRLTKNYVGYIPINPESYRFIIRTSVPIVDNNILNNIFNDDMNSMWEIRTDNINFSILCPEEVIVWKIVMTFQNSNVNGLDINVYGNNSNITSNIIQTINNSTLQNQDLKLNRFKYRGYTIEINRRNFGMEPLKVIRFQMYVLNN